MKLRSSFLRQSRITENNGFSLIEILVAVNIGFIAVTLGLIFFFAARHYLFNALNGFAATSAENELASLIESRLSSGIPVKAYSEDSNLWIINERGDSIRFSENIISINGLNLIDEADSVQISVFTPEGTLSNEISTGILTKCNYPVIDSLNLDYYFMGRKRVLKIAGNVFPAARFINIGKDNVQ